MRKSTCFFLITGVNLTLLAAVGLHSWKTQAAGEAAGQVRARLVRELRLTDLCLFTEARYTRNPALADLNAPFQDHPGALEHFPSGSLVAPPQPTMRNYAHPL